jgi:hypothetical protein
MTSFTLTPVEKGILRCHHTGLLTPEDVHTLAAFFYPDSYYIRDVRYFDTEKEALTWLRNQ